ncbi:MAG TPA: ABC transporter ATP-binding protein [Vicinamibacterales bacterium]|jgi:lipoprotein-releasing system ATP-binding protein|nr:ABC transporter ATP-binding protein [Vicinamibacterales bacterium]
MLSVNRITKSYPTPQGPLPILHEISFSLDRGEAAAIMGPSGSGKSTLLYILGALEPPDAGTLTLDGQNPYALPERDLAAFRNGHIGFVFQDHCLLPQCSVIENVLTPTLVAHDRSPDEYVKRAQALLSDVGLNHRLDHRPAELSGGEKQRVALARGLIREPTLLLCDEPTGNLDQRNADAVADLLLGLHRRQPTILVVVTHSAHLAERFTRRFTITDGRLAEMS